MPAAALKQNLQHCMIPTPIGREACVEHTSPLSVVCVSNIVLTFTQRLMEEAVK